MLDSGRPSMAFFFLSLLIITLFSCSRETTRAQRQEEKQLEKIEQQEARIAQKEYDKAVNNHWARQSEMTMKMVKSTGKQAKSFNKSLIRKGSPKCR